MGKLDLIVSKPEKRTKEQLERLKALPLEQKVNLSLRRIKQFYTEMDGKIYVAFSGGKDSTVLLHMVRALYPEAKAVFADTGLEYPEIRDFVKHKKDIDWVKPNKSFKQVIETHGYPVVSKKVARFAMDLQHSKNGLNAKTANLRRTGVTAAGKTAPTQKMPEKWMFLEYAPFKISDACCNVMKKAPMKAYAKKTGLYPITGVMAEESAFREKSWKENGCNMLSAREPQSRPMMFWTTEDVWEYIKTRELKYSSIYDTGVARTGCIFCMFGHWIDPVDRFELLKKSHPNLHTYCMEKLGLSEVISFIDEGIKNKS